MRLRAWRRVRDRMLAGWRRLSRAAAVRWRRFRDWEAVRSARLLEHHTARLDRFMAWRARFELRLDDAAAGSMRRWLRYVGLALAVTVVAAAALHLLLAATLAGGAWLRWTGVAVVALIAAALEVIVVRNVFISIAAPTQRRTLLIAFLTSAAVLLVSVEAFAGATAAITDSGQLWRAERFYLWHLVDSVPLVAIPRRLAWSEPTQLPGLGGRLLVLAFKTAVIAPLVRLVVAGYELAEEQGRRRRDVLLRAQGRVSAPPRPWSSADLPRKAFLFPVVVVPALLYGALGPGTEAGHRLAHLHPVALAGVLLVIGVAGLAIGVAITAGVARQVRGWWDLLGDSDAGPLAVLAAVALVWIDSPLQLPPVPDLFGLEFGRVGTSVLVWFAAAVALSLLWVHPQLYETLAAGVLVLGFVGPHAPARTFLEHHVTWAPWGLAIGRALGVVGLALTAALLIYLMAMVPRRIGSAGRITVWDPTGRLREELCACLLVCVQIAFAAAALLLFLQEIDASASTGRIGWAAPAAVVAVVWHVVDALPGPDVPNVLGWRLTADFTGRWAGLVIVLAIASTLGIVVFGMIRVVRQWATLKAPPPRHAEGITGEPVAVLAVLDQVLEHLDAAAAAPAPRRPGQEGWAPRLRPRPRAAPSPAVEQHLVNAELARRTLLELLGSEAPMYRAADAAITTMTEAYRQSLVWESGPLRSMLDMRRPGRDESDARARAALDRYRPMVRRWQSSLEPLTRAQPSAEQDEPRRPARWWPSRYGYARVSAREEHPQGQYEALVAAGIPPADIVIDRLAGTVGAQPKLDELLAALKPGDQVVVTRLRRLVGSQAQLLELAGWFRDHRVDLVVLEQGIDTATLIGRVFFETMTALAEFDRDSLIDGPPATGRFRRAQPPPTGC